MCLPGSSLPYGAKLPYPGELILLRRLSILVETRRGIWGPEDSWIEAQEPDFFQNCLSECLLQCSLCFLFRASCAKPSSWLCAFRPQGTQLRNAGGPAHSTRQAAPRVQLTLWEPRVSGGIGVGFGTSALAKGHYFRIRVTTFSPSKLNHTQVTGEAAASHSLLVKFKVVMA